MTNVVKKIIYIDLLFGIASSCTRGEQTRYRRVSV